MIPFKEFNVIGSRVINLQKPCKEDLEWLYITKNLKGKEIGDIYSKSIGTINRWLKKWDIHKKPVKKPDKKELIRLYIEENHNIKEIAVIFSICRPTIRKWLKEYNIKKPKELIHEKRKQTCLKNLGVENPSQSKKVREKRKQTNLERHGAEHALQVEEFQEKAKQTNLERHGAENAMQCEEFQEKAKQTNLERYGVEYPMQSKKIHKKQKETMVERHGVEYPLQSPEIQEKTRKTCLENLGVEYPMQSKKVMKKSEETCLEKYGVKNPQKVEEIKEKAKQTNIERHGVEYPKQSNKIREKEKQNNIGKYGVEYYFQKHIKNYDIWNNHDKFCNWIVKTYKKLGRKITTGDIVNFFNIGIDTAPYKLRQLPEEYNKYYKINASYFEPIVEDWIKDNISSIYKRNKYYDFMLNSNGNKMQLDFFFPSLKIAIEVNDNRSHNPEFRINKGMSPEEALNYEQTKTDLCKAQGIKLIHLWEDDFDNIDTVLKPILDADKK